MKKLFLVFLFLSLIYLGLSSLSSINKTTVTKTTVTEITNKRINDEVKNIRAFLAKKPNYNSEIVFLADMKIMSGSNRFFVYDLKLNKIIDQGLVAHGSGSETNVQNELKFSNVDHSLATSLGKYSIGKSYNGRFGKAYKL